MALITTPSESIPFEQANVYSTSETAIGTWIDGKTIYRKVVTSFSVTYSGKTGSFTISGATLPISVKAILQDIKGGYISVASTSFTPVYRDNRDTSFHTWFKNGTFSWVTAYDETVCKALYFIVEYIK